MASCDQMTEDFKIKKFLNQRAGLDKKNWELDVIDLFFCERSESPVLLGMLVDFKNFLDKGVYKFQINK